MSLLDWRTIWTDLAIKRGHDPAAFKPVPITIGLVEKPAERQERFPVVWMERALLQQGPLAVHKHLLQTSMLPFVSGDNAGARTSLDILARLQQRTAGDVQAFEEAVFAFFLAASLHEFKSAFMRGWRYGTNDFTEELRRWLRAQQFTESWWHERSHDLGPTSFLDNEDFRTLTGRWEPLGRVRPAELHEAIVIGNMRLLEDFVLVTPTFQEDPPADILPDLKLWLEAHKAEQAREAAEREARWQADRDAQAAKKAAAATKRRQLLAPDRRNAEFAPLSWNMTSDARLQVLLFEAPMTELAVRFGVSEAAIRKRVKAKGLTTPPRGHWITAKQT